MKTLTVPAKTDELDRITEFVNQELERYDCPMSIQLQIELAIEEIFVNIASYAYHPEDGEAEVRCDILQDPLRVVIQFLDHGKPYDPLAKENADISPEANEEREGGLGILLVKKAMDNIQYAYENGMNILTILKNLSKKEP